MYWVNEGYHGLFYGSVVFVVRCHVLQDKIINVNPLSPSKCHVRASCFGVSMGLYQCSKDFRERFLVSRRGQTDGVVHGFESWTRSGRTSNRGDTSLKTGRVRSKTRG